MNKCWKFQADIFIHFWFRAKWMKICCTQWTHVVQHESICPIWVHWLQQIFSHLAITQTRIKGFFWNFQHLFTSWQCKFEIKILAITQPACQPRPIFAKTLDSSSDYTCWDICLKFSAFVHHIFAQIWVKNFGPNSNSLPATAHFGQNFKRL